MGGMAWPSRISLIRTIAAMTRPQARPSSVARPNRASDGVGACDVQRARHAAGQDLGIGRARPCASATAGIALHRQRRGAQKRQHQRRPSCVGERDDAARAVKHGDVLGARDGKEAPEQQHKDDRRGGQEPERRAHEEQLLERQGRRRCDGFVMANVRFVHCAELSIRVDGSLPVERTQSCTQRSEAQLRLVLVRGMLREPVASPESGLARSLDP